MPGITLGVIDIRAPLGCGRIALCDTRINDVTSNFKPIPKSISRFSFIIPSHFFDMINGLLETTLLCNIGDGCVLNILVYAHERLNVSSFGLMDEYIFSSVNDALSF